MLAGLQRSGDPSRIAAYPVDGTRGVIEFQHLSKRYGDLAAVNDLELSIDKGEVFGFLGPTAGGRVPVDGLDCHSDRVEVKRRVGYLPDNPIFYDYLRGREIVTFVGEMHGQPRDEAERRTAALLDELALGDAAEEFAVNYSTGMKKKLGLACALIHDPAVLILDEPTNGLDPRASRHVQDRIRVSAAQGKTIFLSTHLLDMAERLCGRVGIIDKGDLVAVGPLKDLQDKLVPGGSLERSEEHTSEL